MVDLTELCNILAHGGLGRFRRVPLTPDTPTSAHRGHAAKLSGGCSQHNARRPTQYCACCCFPFVRTAGLCTRQTFFVRMFPGYSELAILYITTGMESSEFLSQVPLNPQGFVQCMDQSSKRNRSQDICVTRRD